MLERKILRDYMLKGGAKNKAFISDNGEVYIVKGFRFYQGESDIPNIPLIDSDLITEDHPRKRIGLAVGGNIESHLYDKKATLSEIKAAYKPCREKAKKENSAK